MKKKPFKRYYLLSCLAVLLASWYPLWMGASVLCDMIANGTVLKENYPKYIIPYTPICVGTLFAVLLMPFFLKRFRKYALAGAATVAIALFLGVELLLERSVVVTTAETVAVLEDWQMYMCMAFPSEQTVYRSQTAAEILMGDYNPAFKLHFYLISVVLILGILNSLYGFGQMIKSGDKKRRNTLILQSLSVLLFLGLCILACFTAFWRDGSILVSPLSAGLMTAFFLLFGITAGLFAGSLLLRKKRWLSFCLPAVTASVMTLLMYVGEMILLNGHLYRLGTGVLFRSIPGIVLAPMDLLVIMASGCITAVTFALITRSERRKKQS